MLAQVQCWNKYEASELKVYVVTGYWKKEKGNLS